MTKQDKKELLARNKNIAKLASQIKQEIDYISDITEDKDYEDVYSMIHGLLCRIGSLCECVDMGELKGDNSEEEYELITDVLVIGHLMRAYQ
jgi:short-subunit dehydrogenase